MPEGMESFLDVDTSGAQEPVAVESGEHQLRVISGVVAKDKNNHPYFQPRFDVPAEPRAKDFTDFIRLPHSEMDEKALNRAKWRLESFKKCFGIEGSRIDLEQDLPGKMGWAILGVREDPEFGEQNTVRKYILPK